MTYATREAWLQDAAAELSPMIESASGHTLPANLRVACGFPSTFRRSGALGETFAPKDSADGATEILISPTLSNPSEVLAVLARQLMMTVASGAALSRAYAAAGIDPGKTNEVPAIGTCPMISVLVTALGEYPHAELSLADRPKAPTRLLKGLCPTCGYTIRLSAKWAQKGMPTCICGDTFNLETVNLEAEA
jgi:hypothetical protein